MHSIGPVLTVIASIAVIGVLGQDQFFPDDEARINEGDGCMGSDGRLGWCMVITSCPLLLSELQQYGNNGNFLRYLRGSNEVCGLVRHVVCCPVDETQGWDPSGTIMPPVTQAPPPSQPPTQPPTKPPATAAPPTAAPTAGKPHLLTVDEQCGVAKNIKYTKVVGGIDANENSMPWMTLIGYTDQLGDIGWKCGGSLISSRHVLTAAHCIKSTLTTARFGEHDTTKPAATAFNVNVIKVSRHPTYDAKDGHNDLAVLHLERDVPFSDAVRPVCLPLADPVRTRNFVGYNPFVAGWGRTTEGGRPSNVLQQLQLPVLENAVCKAAYTKIGRLISEKQFDEAVLCAGVLDGGQDACQGDSGGPLVQPVQQGGPPNFFQIGVVSYGIGCARANVPGVYTRVQTFVDWITEKVAE